MRRCQKCSSDRVVDLEAKTSDMCTVNVYSNWQGEHEPGYVPDDIGVGGGDYLSFSYCLQCGQLQGDFPLPKTELEGGGEEPEWTHSDEVCMVETDCFFCTQTINPGDQLVRAESNEGNERHFCSLTCLEWAEGS